VATPAELVIPFLLSDRPSPMQTAARLGIANPAIYGRRARCRPRIGEGQSDWQSSRSAAPPVPPSQQTGRDHDRDHAAVKGYSAPATST
jgi:hypothetical protein